LKTIKQPFDSDECVLACIAMVTDQPLHIVRLKAIDAGKWIDSKDQNPTTSLELTTVLLAQHGLFLGLSANFSPALVLEELDLHDDLDVNFRVDDLDGLLTIGEEHSSNRHLVVWDSESRLIRDPHWNAPETTSICGAKIFQWYPLVTKTNMGWC
jgi:hypothetical protein